MPAQKANPIILPRKEQLINLCIFYGNLLLLACFVRK